MLGASLTQCGTPAAMWAMSPTWRTTSFPPSIPEPRVSPGRPAVVLGCSPCMVPPVIERDCAFGDDNLIGEELMALGVAGVDSDYE